MFISQDEFDKACITLNDRYQHLSDNTKWGEVKIVKNYDMRYLQIQSQINVDACRPQQGASPDCLEEEEAGADEDDEVLDRLADDRDQVVVIYDIIHSPSYQVPVLYVTVKQRSPGERGGTSIRSADELYQLLIPPSYRQQVQAVGVMGAVSMTDHPATGTPTYFMHPCRTAEAMSAVSEQETVTPDRYLLMWLGLVGPSVGLNVPIELAEAMSVSR